MCEYNDRLLAVAWWVILNSPDLWLISSSFSTSMGRRCSGPITWSPCRLYPMIATKTWTWNLHWPTMFISLPRFCTTIANIGVLPIAWDLKIWTAPTWSRVFLAAKAMSEAKEPEDALEILDRGVELVEEAQIELAKATDNEEKNKLRQV